MTRLLVLLLIGYGLYLLLRRTKHQIDAKPRTPDETETYRDPVCGVYVAPEDATVGTVEGKKLYFCSMACLEKYREQL